MKATSRRRYCPTSARDSPVWPTAVCTPCTIHRWKAKMFSFPMVYGTGSAGRKVRAQPGNSDAQPGIPMWAATARTRFTRKSEQRSEQRSIYLRDLQYTYGIPHMLY